MNETEQDARLLKFYDLHDRLSGLFWRSKRLREHLTLEELEELINLTNPLLIAITYMELERKGNK